MSLLSQFFGGGGGTTLIPVEILAVGGGGGGGQGKTAPSIPGAGGGGAGQFIYSNTYAVVGKSYTVTIAGGGAASSPGSNTTISGLGINAVGGGAGGYVTPTNLCVGGPSNGGSGGGGYNTPTTLDQYQGRSAFNPSFTPTGISGSNPGGPISIGIGGGGGAKSSSGRYVLPVADFVPGDPASSSLLPFGGLGLPMIYVGISTTVCGGGGGGGWTYPTRDANAIDGGGSGYMTSVPVPLGGPVLAAVNGTANTGGGGGGGGVTPIVPDQNGASGGSGVVIIRYPTAFDAATVTGDTPVTPQPGYYVYRWNGSGSITFN